MKTFQEFLNEAYLILERNRYDDSHGFDRRLSPDERQHWEITYDGPREKKEIEKHYKSMGREVPYEPGHTKLYHKPTGITYEITHHRPENQNPRVSQRPEHYLTGRNQRTHGHKPSHEVQWYPAQMDTSDIPLGKRAGIARNAFRLWKSIQHRIPSGHLITNEPETKSLKKKYEKSAIGFGGTTPKSNKQYSAKIGNKLHPINRDT